MLLTAVLTLLLQTTPGPIDFQPAYEREGDRVEQEFRLYQQKLSTFFALLRDLIEQQTVNVQLPRLQDLPPAPVLYGHGALPRIVDAPPAGSSPPVATFSYSWPVTERYIKNEEIKLELVKEDCQK